MKRGGPQHPKTLHLANLLELTRYEAVGLLECLFHWAGTYARRGDIGRFPNSAIADGIGWEGDAEKLIAALVESRWIDECECHRLRIHDWKDHADQPVHKTKEVTTLGFLECYASGGSPSEGWRAATKNGHGTGIRHKAQGTGNRAQGDKPKNFVAEAIDIHREHLGEPSAARIGKALKPLVDGHTWEVVRPLWVDACVAAAKWTEPGKFTPEVFARSFVAELAKRVRAPAVTPREPTKAELRLRLPDQPAIPPKPTGEAA